MTGKYFGRCLRISVIIVKMLLSGIIFLRGWSVVKVVLKKGHKDDVRQFNATEDASRFLATRLKTAK